MAIIKKYAEVLPTPLTNYNTFVVDTNPNSTYFKITEFKESFTGGKNGFLIEGSEHLKETTEIKIQILDVNGDPIYYEPGNGVPEYYEGISKVIAVYVYEDTPIGEAKITILGELKTYVDDNGITQQIPEDWQGIYNLKWEKTFKVNKLLSNEDKVRFYRRPEVTINEIVKPIFNNIVTPVVQKGFAFGRSQTPAAGQPLANYTLPTSYLITTSDNSAWTGSVVGTYLEFTDLGVNLLVDDIVDNNNLTVSTPFTQNGLVADFTSSRYTASFNYTEGVDNLKTALTGSFAKITISDLTTFVGDVARVKIFRKSQSDLADYQFVQEIQLESNEVLVDLESQTKNQEFYGLFDQNNFKNYWVTSSNSLTTTFNQNYLFNSVKLDGNVLPTYYHTSKSFDLKEGVEYTLGLSYRGDSTTTAGGALSQLRIFISGSRESTYGGITSTTPVEQNIVTYKGNTSAILQKTIDTVNFQSENFINPKLYFEVKGTGWHIADVSLRASQETSFSPDEITFIQPIPRTLPAETFDFLFQFYDINNNYIPVVVTETKTFDGGNLNVINKSIELIPSSLYFQFDSGSGNGNPVPPTVINIDIVKNYLTGSYTFTSRSFDFFGTELSSSMYSQLITPGWGGGQFPGYLNDNNGSNNNVFLTVQNFTGSRDPSLEEIVVQFIEYTVECEGVEDSIVITRVIDGKGGVNYEIRPYNGTIIRNSHPSSSLEVQAIRIDGVNEVKLQRGLPAGKSNTLLYVQSGSTYITLLEASQSQFVRGIQPGVTGSGQVEYNAIFNRDSINGQLTLYMIPTGSTSPSESILTSLTLTDIQDGLDAGVILYDADTFTINPRTQTKFTPVYSSATASFYKRGTFEAPISASFEIYPSMSINKDWVPEYWMQFTTWSCAENITIAAYDESGSIINPRPDASNFIYGSPLSQSKQLLISVTYTEPWTSASVSVDKLFQIVPEGKPGDESIVFEVVPSTVALGANSRGIVNDYKPTIAEIKLKQGARYLSFTGSVATSPFASHGTFHVATSSIRGINIVPGNIQFTSSNGVDYTASLIISASSNLTQLSGSIEIPLQIHPYFTSSIYTQSVFLNYTKVLEGAPPIQVIITPSAPNLKADEVGYISDYTAANTTIQVKDGDDFLRFTTQSTAPGTFRIQNGGSVVTSNITAATISSSSFNTATLAFNRFDYPYVSASAQYNIVVYPYALGPGHEYTSSVVQRTQTFTKNVAPANARTVNLKASYDTVNFNKDGVVSAPLDPIILTATATNTTGAVWFQFFKDDTDYTGIVPEDAPGAKYATMEIGGGDATGPGENATWTVRIRDGNSSSTAPIRAENSLTIAGIKAGADSYKLLSTNDNCSITADLWTTSFTGTGMKITTFKGTEQLENVPYYNYNTRVDDYLGNFIGYLGYSSASIFSKSSWITMVANKFPTSNPAEIGNITAWTAPATNKSGQIVYKVEFEGESSGSYLTRQTQFVTQSISVQFEPPAPYDIKLTNESSAVVYKVAGSISFQGTGNIIRAYRGGTELTNTSTMPATDTDAYGTTGLSKDKCRVSVYSKSGHITLAGGLTAGSFISGTPATMASIVGWTDPNANPIGQIVYQIDCEGRQTFYKTQSLAIQYEGAVGPGLVMRGEWSNTIDYYGSVENINDRLDVVTFQATQDETKYYAAISGSGPTTYVNPTTSTFYRGASPPAGYTLIGAQQPLVDGDNEYWRYLGQEDFFVAAKLAIFERSYVKNSINVGTKDTNGAFANIVINGGRPDPYIALGQFGTIGTAGTAGSSAAATGVIGYDRPGIFLGVYENGAAGTTGRFSIKTSDTSGKGMFWDGDTLTIIGAIRQVSPGVSEGSLRGAWTAGYTYYANDIVSYQGQSWQCTSATSHVATNNTNGTTGYPGAGPWIVAAAAGTSGTAGSGGTAGTAGGPGPGVVYRGPFAAGTQYFREATRRDVVQGTDGQYYLCKVTYTPSDNTTRPIDGGSYTTYWESFGATFSSVATNILLAQDATITRGLVIGTEGSNTGFIRSADASSITAGTGFYLDAGGRMRLGQTVSAGNNYLYWNGTTLELSGVLTATAGSIGGWTITSAGLDYTSADGNRRVKLNSSRGALEVFYSGSLLVDINSNTALTDLTSVAAVWPSVSGTPYLPSGTVDGDGTPYYGAVHGDTAALTAGKTYQFTWGTGFIPTITNSGEYLSVAFGLLLSTNSTPTVANSTYFLSGGGYKSGAGNLQLQSFTTVFLATTSATYYVRPYMVVYSSEETYDPFTEEYSYAYVDATLNSDLYFYGGNITPSIEKTEIVGGGIQVVKDSDTYFKVDRNASGGLISPFVYSVGSSATFRGDVVSSGNAFTVDNFDSVYIEGGSTYITMDNTTYAGLYGSAGVRISPGQFVWLEPGAGYYAVVGNSTTNANMRIKVADGSNPSDERLKAEIEILPSGSLDKLNEIQLKTFKYIDTATNEAVGNTKVGVIAQDIQKTSLKNFVIEQPGGDLYVDYDSLFSHAIKAIQELNKKVEKLEAQISGSL